jgi:hypothetical protein
MRRSTDPIPRPILLQTVVIIVCAAGGCQAIHSRPVFLMRPSKGGRLLQAGPSHRGHQQSRVAAVGRSRRRTSVGPDTVRAGRPRQTTVVLGRQSGPTGFQKCDGVCHRAGLNPSDGRERAVEDSEGSDFDGHQHRHCSQHCAPDDLSLPLRVADLQEKQQAAADEHDDPQDGRYLGSSEEQKLLPRTVGVAQVRADLCSSR